MTRGTKSTITVLTAALVMLTVAATNAGAATPAGDVYVLNLPGSEGQPLGGDDPDPDPEAPLTDPGGIVGERVAPEGALGAGLRGLWQPGGFAIALVLGAATVLVLRRTQDGPAGRNGES